MLNILRRDRSALLRQPQRRTGWTPFMVVPGVWWAQQRLQSLPTTSLTEERKPTEEYPLSDRWIKVPHNIIKHPRWGAQSPMRVAHEHSSCTYLSIHPVIAHRFLVPSALASSRCSARSRFLVFLSLLVGLSVDHGPFVYICIIDATHFSPTTLNS